MAELIREGMRDGIWQGVLVSDAAPEVEVLLGGDPVEMELTALGAGRHALAVPIPLSALEDGVQTFVIRDRTEGTTIGHFSIAAGRGMEDDLRAEVELLRAELDLLKRAFRRHCLETMPQAAE